MENTEKIFLRFDDFHYKLELERINEQCTVINQNIFPLIVGLKFKPTRDYLIDAIHGCIKMKVEYFKLLEKDLDNFSNQTIKQSLYDDAANKFDEFNMKIKNAGSINCIDMIKIESGRAVADTAKLKEQYETWITDPKEIRIRRLHESACDAINKFLKEDADSLMDVFTTDNNKVVPSPYTNYEYFATTYKY